MVEIRELNAGDMAAWLRVAVQAYRRGDLGDGLPRWPEHEVFTRFGLLEDGDIIEIDADAGTLNVKLTAAELADRKTKWAPRATTHTSGALWKYAQQVGPAVDGAVTHPGGAHETQCYADI